MTRFIALVWDDRDGDSLHYALSVRQWVAGSRDWVTVTDGAGLAVFLHSSSHMREKPVPLDREAGLILGTLFDRQVVAVETSPRRSCIGARQTEDILRTQGRSLTESDWGSYLLFLRRLPEQTVSIFRGPAGTLSCYYRTLNRPGFSGGSLV